MSESATDVPAESEIDLLGNRFIYCPSECDHKDLYLCDFKNKGHSYMHYDWDNRCIEKKTLMQRFSEDYDCETEDKEMCNDPNTWLHTCEAIYIGRAERNLHYCRSCKHILYPNRNDIY